MPGVLALPLGLFGEGLLGVLVLAAATALALLGFNLARRLPWPFYNLAGLIFNAIVVGIRAMVIWSTESANNLAATFRALFVNPWIVAMHTGWSIGDTALALNNFKSTTIPRAVNAATGPLYGAVQQARLEAQNAVTGALWTAYQWIQSLSAYVGWVYQSATAYAGALYRVAIQHADQVGTQAIQHADLIGAQAVQHADAIGQDVTRYAQALDAQALGYAYQVGVAAEGLTRRVERESLDYTRRVGQDVAGYAAQLAAAVTAFTVTRTGVLATAIDAIERSPCMRVCDPLGNLGGVVQDLEAAGIEALLIGLLAETIRDPHGVLAEIRSVGTPVAQEAASGLGAVVGLGGRG